MLKKIAIALALVIPTTATAQPRIYDVHATRVVSPKESSCSHGTDRDVISRLMGARLKMKVDDDAGTVTVNGMRWKLTGLADDPNPGLFTDMTFSFHDRDDQLVYLELNVYVNMRGLSGTYTLHGVDYAGNPRREPCYDTVQIDGTAR